MAVSSRHPMIRWAVPALAVAAIGAASVAPSAIADPALPPKTAEQLLVDLKNQQASAFSGTVESSSDLGLPALPIGTESDFAALTSGTHTLRVWHAGDHRSRVTLLGDGSEATVIQNGSDIWQWSSSTGTAKHAVVSKDHPTEGERPAQPHTPVTPQEAAEQALAHIEPTTAVTVSQTSRVAGRPAYELVLEPKSDDTLVAKVTLAVDAETNAPLRVEVWGNGADKPAIQVGFTSVEFAAPDASVFEFNPPAGTTVEPLETGANSDRAPHGERAGEKPAGHAEPTVVGEGWDKVTVTALPALPENDDPATQRRAEHRGEPADFRQMIDQLPTVQGPWGTGRVLTSALFTVVVTDDGRMAVGMVPADTVVAAIPQ
ncbi:MAG: sigma-E factor regulatory protein RseB domain-containing protein [Propionibacteriaceae bacterium]|nr:sigma-E factor regulatory protein RseB domain-containing protein [Propionibacteriaceae bacterium]